MSITAQLTRVVVYALPLLFVAASWVVASGYPYYIDNNETFLSYVHARNLEIWDPAEYGWLTAHGTDPEQSATEFVYSHNPNGPRYLHYVLLQVGIREISQHVLILSLLGTGLTVWLLWRLFAHPLLLVVPLAVVLDYAGFLAWTVNTYRVWTFVLYFGMALAVARNRAGWLALLTFLLFQIEYGLALFITTTMTFLALLLHGRQAWWLIAASAVGASVSLALFGVQVLAYYGWDGLVAEVEHTLAHRGPADVGGGLSGSLAALLVQGWRGMFMLIQAIAHETHNRAVVLIVTAGSIVALAMLARGRYVGERRLVAALYVATLAGCAITATLLHGYFVDAYVWSVLPISVFLVAPATGIVAIEVRDAVTRLGGSARLAGTLALLPLAPVLFASLTLYQPPVAVDFLRQLQHDYRGRTIVAPDLGAWQMGPALAFALTGGRAAPTDGIEVTPADQERLRTLRDPDGTLTYACLDTLYIRIGARRGDRSTCEQGAASMLGRGHELLSDGFGWAIVRVYPDDRTPALARDAAGPADPLTARQESAAPGR